MAMFLSSLKPKRRLETADVRKYIETMEKFRTYAHARWNDPTRFVGAVAGAVVDDEAKDLAHANGYVCYRPIR